VKVIKLGGSLLEDATRRAQSLQSIAASFNAGEQIVLVHGGGKHIDALLSRLGIAKRTHAGLRITDDETLPVVVGVLAGIVNKMLVGELSALGVRAAGISGADAGTLVAGRRSPAGGVDFGHVGDVRSSDPTLIRALLAQRILPVVSSVGISDGGALLNINADSAASAIAIAVAASSLTFVTDVPGVLDGSGAVVPSLNARKVRSLIKTNVITGGMRPKLEAALHALSAGVQSIRIGEHAVILSRADGEGSRPARSFASLRMTTTGGTELVAA
jgi:acetylglutamate kinase